MLGASACASASESEDAEESLTAVSPTPTSTASQEEELRDYLAVECAAELAEYLELDDATELELFELEEPTMSDDASLFGLQGRARYPTASGAATTSDRFNCAILAQEDGDLKVEAFTY